ncbi:MAG: GDSL-type esterase/lipase family protein [Eubacterium sp.]
METNEILMIGDSLIEYGDWENLLNRKINNRGIGGDTTYGVSCRIRRNLKRHPEKIILMVGANDIISGETVETIAKQYEVILKLMRTEIPNSEIIIHKVLPCNPEKLFFVFDNNQAIALNTEIIKLGKKYNTICVDLWEDLTEKSELIKKYTLDGVHLTKEAYLIWAERLKTVLDYL